MAKIYFDIVLKQKSSSFFSPDTSRYSHSRGSDHLTWHIMNIHDAFCPDQSWLEDDACKVRYDCSLLSELKCDFKWDCWWLPRLGRWDYLGGGSGAGVRLNSGATVPVKWLMICKVTKSQRENRCSMLNTKKWLGRDQDVFRPTQSVGDYTWAQQAAAWKQRENVAGKIGNLLLEQHCIWKVLVKTFNMRCYSIWFHKK